MKDILVSVALLGSLTGGLMASYSSLSPEKQTSEKPGINQLKVKASGHNWVELKWNEPKSPLIEHIHVFRGDTLIARVGKGKQTFTDRLLLDNKLYGYSAEVHYTDDTTSRKLTVSAKTKANIGPKLDWHASSVKIASNIEFGDEITLITASDPESDELYFSLEGEDAKHFLINPSTGKIIFGESKLVKKDYLVKVKVSDGNKHDTTAIRLSLN